MTNFLESKKSLFWKIIIYLCHMLLILIAYRFVLQWTLDNSKDSIFFRIPFIFMYSLQIYQSISVEYVNFLWIKEPWKTSVRKSFASLASSRSNKSFLDPSAWAYETLAYQTEPVFIISVCYCLNSTDIKYARLKISANLIMVSSRQKCNDY